MSNPQRIVLLVSAAAGVLLLLVLGFTVVEVADCHRDYAAYGGLDLCDLGWFIGGAFAVLIGLGWLLVVGIVAIAGLVRRHRRS